VITVLGARGYIGSALVEFLNSAGEHVYAPRRGEENIFQKPLGHVIYSIGLTSDFRSRPHDTVRAHVSFLNEFLEKANFDTFTYLSSTRVYSGLAEATPMADLCVNPCRASDLYNLTKLTGEALCAQVSGRPSRIVRLSNVVGIGRVPSENFINTILKEAISGKLIMRSARNSSKDYVLLEDVVRVLPQIALKGSKMVYNLASGINLENHEWTDRLSDHLDVEVDYQEDLPEIIFPKVDISNLRDEFTFSPSPVLDSIPSLIQYYKNLK
jgi:nucleoside-diphosphate-sugar epimerase